MCCDVHSVVRDVSSVCCATLVQWSVFGELCSGKDVAAAHSVLEAGVVFSRVSGMPFFAVSPGLTSRRVGSSGE